MFSIYSKTWHLTTIHRYRAAAMLFMLLVLLGCVYDPPRGRLKIVNNTEETLYFYLDHDNKHQLPSNIFFVLVGKTEPHGYNGETIGGSLEKPELGQERIDLIIIPETTINNEGWANIIKKKLYDKRYYTEKQLKAMNWTIEIDCIRKKE